VSFFEHLWLKKLIIVVEGRIILMARYGIFRTLE